MMKKLNCAVIGAGVMGKNHIRVLSELENVSLVAVADAMEGNLNFVSSKYDVDVYSDYTEIIKKNSLDFVNIITPTKTHYEIAKYFIEQKVNVFVEKPITDSIEEGQKLIELAKANEVALMVGHIERFNPAIIELKRRLDNGNLGKVFKIDINRVGPFPSRVRDVGVVIDLAVHDLDIVRYLLNSEATRIFAETAKQIHTSHEDLLSAILRFDNGTICNFNINWLTPTKIRKLYITGEKGMYIVNYLNQELYYYENSFKAENSYPNTISGVSEGNMVRYAIDKNEPLKLELLHFVECIQNNKKPMTTGEDGLKVVDLARKIIQSAESGDVL